MTDLDFINDVPMVIKVIYSEKTMPVREYLDLKEGQAITLEKLAGEPLDFFVNDRLLARGEIVVNNEKYAIRLTEIIGKDPNKSLNNTELQEEVAAINERKEAQTTASTESNETSAS